MSMVLLAMVACLFALIPAMVFHRNLRAYKPPPLPEASRAVPKVSVLIPARNEECSIRAAVESVLASQGVELEVTILDDHSWDATAAIVRTVAERDRRVRLVRAPLLPAGWCGKQHACAVLAQTATAPLLVFLDADVRLGPHGLARMVAFLEHSGADLASGFPRQETGTILEHLVIPLMHFLLLGFLPLWRMRASRHPAYGAGCGQLFITCRAAYDAAGGHSAIRESLHDGVKLPRSFRRAGFTTDLFDATQVATCRMYHSATEVWHGLMKNAGEGLAAPALIVPAMVLLVSGQVLPLILLALGLLGVITPVALGFAAAGTVALYYPRLAAVRRFRHPLFGALLHPLGVLILLSIQWHAFARLKFGHPATWKGRQYVTP